MSQFKAIRVSKGLTQKDVAETLGISQVSVCQWENGGFPDAKKLPEIAKLYGCTIDELFGGSDTDDKERS